MERKRPVCAKKCAQKETSRPTGKLKYSTGAWPGQHFFAGFFGFFQGFRACSDILITGAFQTQNIWYNKTYLIAFPSGEGVARSATDEADAPKNKHLISQPFG
jgi:hypothetical protein